MVDGLTDSEEPTTEGSGAMASSTLLMGADSPSSSMDTCRSSGSGADWKLPSRNDSAGRSMSRSPVEAADEATRPRRRPVGGGF